MKKVIFALALLPTLSLAAPSGQSLCQDATGKYQFTIGTYAAAGDGGTLKVGNQSFGVNVEAGEGEGDLVELMQVFCMCEPKEGAKVAVVKWDVTQGDRSEPTAVKMIITGKKVTELNMICKALDYKPGNEQN
ncbi:MAG: hypothetical protein ACXVCY_17760 [Pseudobdellovibrionaceae bacterium]